MSLVKIDGIPRRNIVESRWDVEKRIAICIKEVELLGADELLTQAITLLNEASDKVADYIDKQIIETELKNEQHASRN